MFDDFAGRSRPSSATQNPDAEGRLADRDVRLLAWSR